MHMHVNHVFLCYIGFLLRCNKFTLNFCLLDDCERGNVL